MSPLTGTWAPKSSVCDYSVSSQNISLYVFEHRRQWGTFCSVQNPAQTLLWRATPAGLPVTPLVSRKSPDAGDPSPPVGALARSFRADGDCRKITERWFRRLRLRGLGA